MKQILLILAMALIANYTLSQKYQEGGYKSYEDVLLRYLVKVNNLEK